MVLIARSLSSPLRRALHTTPMPPCPIFPRIAYFGSFGIICCIGHLWSRLITNGNGVRTSRVKQTQRTEREASLASDWFARAFIVTKVVCVVKENINFSQIALFISWVEYSATWFVRRRHVRMGRLTFTRRRLLPCGAGEWLDDVARLQPQKSHG